MSGFWSWSLAFITFIGVLALVSVLVSRNAQTPQVAQSVFSGIAQDISAATAPVTGGGMGAGFFGNTYSPSFNLG